MKKIVMKLDIQDSKAKQKALKAVCTVSGIDSISVDMKEKNITIIGDVDPIRIASKLRKNWHTEIFSVGPAKEPEKKEEPKKEAEPKKVEEPKKIEEPKKEEEPKRVDEPKKKEDEKKDKPKKEEENRKDPNEELFKSYRAYYPYYTTQYYVPSVEENPNSCVIF